MTDTIANELTLGVFADSRFVTDGKSYATKSNLRRAYLTGIAGHFRKTYVFVRVWNGELSEFPPEDRISTPSIEFVHLPVFDGLRGYLRNRRRLRSLIESWMPKLDVVNPRLPGQIGNLAARITKAYGKPSIATVITDPRVVLREEKRLVPVPILRPFVADFVGNQLGRACAACDEVLGVSQAIADAYATSGQPRHAIADTCLDDKAYSPPTARDPSEPLCFMYAGRLWEYKNCQAFIRALAKSIRAGFNVKAIIAGDGPYRPTLQTLAKSLGIEDKVTFPGYIVSRAVLKDWWSKAHVGFLVSHSEGLPLGAIEPMAAGLPMIVSDRAFMDDIVVDGVHGIRVEPTDEQAISAAIERLASDESLRQTLADNAYRRALDYSVERQSQRFAEAAARVYAKHSA